MPFSCSICVEESTRICVRCTKDACDNHLCEKCRKCSDCCECEVALSPHPQETVREAMHAAVAHAEIMAESARVETVPGMPVEAVAVAPVGVVAETPAEAPLGVVAETPAETVPETTTDALAETPAGTVVAAPSGVASETPMEAAADAVADTPAEAIAETPAEPAANPEGSGSSAV